MKAKTKPLVFLLFICTTSMAQSWEYVNLRQYRVKDDDVLTAFVKHAYPWFNKSKRIPAVNRAVATGESGRVYGATYFSSMDQFTTFIKEWPNDWAEYAKSPGSQAQNLSDNMEGGVDDVLWHLDKDMTNVPAGVDVSKMAWRKLHFITVKSGMMADFSATRKQILEAEKKVGIDYPVLVMTVAFGAPTNMVLFSSPAANAADYYTAQAARAKIRSTHPEIIALWKKLGTMGSNALIDQITMVPY